MLKSWMIIAIVTFVVALGSGLLRPRDIRWFKHLRRPRWLVFEWAIPLIWTVIFVCGAWSAYIVWEKEPGTVKTWLLMVCYLLVEITIVAYSPVMLRLQSLKVGTIIGGIGAVFGVMLAIAVLIVASGWAALLLLPYIIWSPIGTYTTWEMIRLNPADA